MLFTFHFFMNDNILMTILILLILILSHFFGVRASVSM